MLVDSNVLLDVLTEDSSWYHRSASALSRVADRADLALNPIVHAEISVGFESLEELEEAEPPDLLQTPGPPVGGRLPRRKVLSAV